MEKDNTNARKRKQSAVDDDLTNQTCPYLDTVQRSLLDFDLEPACSITLETGPHIYGCLVCGKFFRGRGRQTPAYTHAVEESHFVFVHLTQGTFHCLPDDYEIHDTSLSDVRAALHPQFTPEYIVSLDFNTQLSRDLLGRRYLPGFIGLNNLHKTDCINAVVQALAHVPPLRDYFLRHSEIDNTNNIHKHRMAYHVTECFGELMRKMWSDTRFKSHVDPHRLVQAVAAASKTKFPVGQQAEAGELVAWLLHQLHLGTGGSLNMNSKKKSKQQSIIQKVFQGEVMVVTRQAARSANQVKESEAERSDDREGSGDEEEEPKVTGDVPTVAAPQIEEITHTSSFLQLTLDIPEKPLFRDENGGLVIPQEPLSSVLRKFDGVSFWDAVSASGVVQRKKYQLLRLPNYLILHLARFKTNQYSREKNPTIVAFPVKNLDLSDYVNPVEGKPKLPTEAEVRRMNVSATKSFYVFVYGLSDGSFDCRRRS
jgi:U4/U6.U5 tri-snRNP-associated protein 2